MLGMDESEILNWDTALNCNTTMWGVGCGVGGVKGVGG